MPMVGHIAETGQVVACDFRVGNAAPARENFEFIQQCERSLPDEAWQPLLDKNGGFVNNQQTYRTSNCIGDYKKNFHACCTKKVNQGTN